MGVSMAMGHPKMDGLVRGKSYLDMDDFWATPISGNLHIFHFQRFNPFFSGFGDSKHIQNPPKIDGQRCFLEQRRLATSTKRS